MSYSPIDEKRGSTKAYYDKGFKSKAEVDDSQTVNRAM